MTALHHEKDKAEAAEHRCNKHGNQGRIFIGNPLQQNRSLIDNKARRKIRTIQAGNDLSPCPIAARHVKELAVRCFS